MAPEDAYPVRWAGRQALVALPEHIDVSNAGQIREELLSVINRGAEALIADMTATLSCDNAGADAVARAYQRAVTSRTELRLVVTSGVVLRMLGMTGVGRLVPVYPSVEAALAARSPAARATLTVANAGTTRGSRRRRMTGTSPGSSVQAGPDVGVEVALLDRDGVIAWVNQAWQAFAAANGGDPARTGIGVSYLQACAAAGDDPVAAEVAGAIRAALAGDLPGPLRVGVPCHSPATERWFDVLISSRFDDQGRCVGATVTLSLARSQPRSGRGPTLVQGRPGAAAVMSPGVLWNVIEAFSDGVARGGIHLVHQRRTDHVDLGSHGPDFQIAVHRGGAIAVDQHFGMALRVETFFGERELVGARRQVRNRIRTGGLRLRGNRQVSCGVAGRNGNIRHSGPGRVSHGAGNRA